jgi:uncharacterized protein YgiM (DUF1202 family)
LIPSAYAASDSYQTGQIVNCKTAVNVRSGPGTGYPIIGTAPKGAVYTVTGRSGSYYQINYNSRAGYVYSSYLAVSSVQTADKTATTGTGMIVNCNSGVNVRSGPGTSYPIIGTAPKGAVYPVTGKSGSYYQISFNGKTGYVYSSYISVTASAPTPSPTPTPTPSQTRRPRRAK